MSRPPIGQVRWIVMDNAEDVPVPFRVEITGGGPMRTVYRHLDGVLRGQRQSMDTREFGRSAKETPSAALLARAMFLGAAADRAKAEAARLDAKVRVALDEMEKHRPPAAHEVLGQAPAPSGKVPCPRCHGQPFSGALGALGCPRCRGQGEVGPGTLVEYTGP